MKKRKTSKERIESRYFPSDCKITEYKDIDVVIGVKHNDNKCTAIAYSGTKEKHDWYYSFEKFTDNEAYMNKYIYDYISRMRKNKIQRLAPGINELPFKVGDFIYSSWGYEQTNVDFFEIIEIKSPNTIILREVEQERKETSFMAGNTIPLKGCYISNPLKKRVQWFNKKPMVTIDSQIANLWEGNPLSYSSYA